MRLQTPRYRLRDFAPNDRESFTRYQTSARYRQLYDFAGGSSRADVLFDKFLSWQDEVPRRNVQVGVFDQDGVLKGCAGLRMDERRAGCATLGLELVPEAWGQFGAAVEIAGAVIAHGFDALDLALIAGETSSGNTRVERLARFFGGKVIARGAGDDWMQARSWHPVTWGLDATGWRSSRARRWLLERHVICS